MPGGGEGAGVFGAGIERGQGCFEVRVAAIAEVGKAGYGPLQQLWLRWFDHYVKGKKDAALLKDVKPFTYYEQGTGAWVAAKKYVDKDLHAASYRLSGSAALGGSAGGLVLTGAKAGTSDLPALPVTVRLGGIRRTTPTEKSDRGPGGAMPSVPRRSATRRR